jgi:hypothetical protein
VRYELNVEKDILVFLATLEDYVDLVLRLFYLATDHQIVINGSIFPIFSQQVGNFSETLVLFLPPLVPLPRDDFVWE